MTSRWNSIVLGTVALAAVPAAPAQRGDPPEAASRVQFTVFERPSSHPDSVRLDVLFRIPGNQFVFLRDQASGEFVARGELLVELRNDDGSRISRDIRPIDIRRQTQVARQEDIDDYQGLIRFTLAADEYRATVEIKDKEAGTSFLDRSRTYAVGALRDGAGVFRLPLLGYRDSVTRTVRPFNRREGVVFGARGGVLLNLRPSDSAATVVLTWSLESDPRNTDAATVRLSGVHTVAQNDVAVPDEPSYPLAYRFAPSPGGHERSAFVPLPLEKLEPGVYALHVGLSGQEPGRRMTFTFPVVWPGRPMSLSRFDIAVDALRYIATEDDIDDMTGFMADGGRERFREFWRRKDPDTTTAYNEVLEEYYRRVDEAIRRFSDRGDLDGYKTDRGRILILFGTPTTMERVFRPDSGPREVWTYQNVRKRFVFTDPSRTGDYRLSMAEDL